MFPVLFREGNVFAASERSAGAATEAVLFTLMVLAAIVAIFGLVTEFAEMTAGKLPVPDPITSPVSVMVWFPVFVPVIASSLVLSAALILPAALVVAAKIEMAGALPPDDTMGAVPVTPVTVPVVGVDHWGAVAPEFIVNTCPAVPFANKVVAFAADW